MGENLINTSRQSSLYGENSTLTGDNISKEELNNLISTQSDKIQARNNKQQELDRTATNISTNQLNQDTIRRRIELLKEANREATRKNEALQNLTNQKTSKEQELNALRQALESAKADATNQITHTDRTVWSNFENQLRSLNWDKLTESNGVDQLANELKTKVENDFPTITKYDVEKYKPLINGYVNSKGIFGKNKEDVRRNLSGFIGNNAIEQRYLDYLLNTLIEENKHQTKLVNQLNDFFPKNTNNSGIAEYRTYYYNIDELNSLNNVISGANGWEYSNDDLRPYLHELLSDNEKVNNVITQFYNLKNKSVNSESELRDYRQEYDNLSSNELIDKFIKILDKHKLYTEENYSYSSNNNNVGGVIRKYNITDINSSLLNHDGLTNDLKQLITESHLKRGNNQESIQKYLTYNKFSHNQEVIDFIQEYMPATSLYHPFDYYFSFSNANRIQERDLYKLALSSEHISESEANLINGDASSMVDNLLNTPLLKNKRTISNFISGIARLDPDNLIKRLKESDVVEASNISYLKLKVDDFKSLNSLINWDADQSKWTINKEEYKQKFAHLEQYFKKIEDYITSYQKATQDPSNKEKNAEMLKKYHDLINGEADFFKKQKITETTLSQKGQELLEKFNRIASESNDKAVAEMNDMIDKLKLFDRNHQIVREVNEKVAELTNNVQSKEREIAEKQAELNNINTSISNNALTEEERNANTLREEKERELAEKQREKEQLEQEKATKERELEELNRAIQSGNLTNKGLQNIGIGYNNFNSGTKAITIGNENTVLADGAVAIGNNNNLSKEATNTFVLGSNVTTNIPNSVALGKDTALSAPIATPSHTIAGTQYNFAGIAPVGTVSIGAEGKERTLTNLAAGRISNTSTDGINGSQLNAVIETLNGLSTELTTLKNAPKVKAPVIKAGDGLSLTEGEDGSVTLSNALTFNSGSGINVNKEGNNITITNTRPLSAEDKTKYDTASTNASSALEKANTNEGSINTANGKINDLTSRVTANEGNITTLTGKVTTVTNTANEALGKANTAVQPDRLKAGNGISIDKAENGDITVTNTKPFEDTDKEKLNTASTNANSALEKANANEGAINTANGKITANEGKITIQEGKVNDLTSRVTANEGNITTLVGNVTTVTNTANEALEKANQALKPTDLVAGKGIQVTQDEDGRMKIASNLVAGEGVDLSESNGNTVVKSLIDIQAGKGINVNKNGNVFTISSVGNAIPKLEIAGDNKIVHEVTGALSVVGDENIETNTQGGKVNVKLKKNIQVDSLKVGDNLLTQGGLKIGNAIITDKGSNMGNQVIDGVADGEISPNSQQVINGSQIYEMNRHFGENINNLQQQISSQNERMEKLNRENQAGIANVVAMANLPQATLPGRSMISAAVGTHKNARAVSVGVSRLSDNQKLSIKFSASTSVSKGKATVSAGAGVGLHF